MWGYLAVTIPEMEGPQESEKYAHCGQEGKVWPRLTLSSQNPPAKAKARARGTAWNEVSHSPVGMGVPET